MVIIRRKSVVKEPVIEATSHDDQKHHARHPHLNGLRQDVYYFVGNNPYCNRDDVGRGLGVKSSTITARIKELIDEGFLMEPSGRKKISRAGVSCQCLHVTDRPMGGKPLDKVRVEVTLTIDCNGVYGATARVIGDKPQSGIPHPIKTQRFTLTAPHPDSYKSSTQPETITTVSRMDTQAHADQIIDASAYTVVD